MYHNLELENQVINIVKEASKLIKNMDFAVTEKDGNSNIVTTSDLLVQKFLCDNLIKLIPNSSFYCEENNIRDFSKEYVWIIDPIDGTTNYSRGIAECAISVGLLHNNNSVLGVVYNIFQDEVFSATVNLGARLNNKLIKVSERKFNESILCTAMSLYKKSLAEPCNKIIYDIYMKCNDYRRFGSCALELCYLACGRCDLYFEIRVFPWDYAGAYLILKEAGGVLKGFDKQELLFDKTTTLVGANNKSNFNKINAVINKYLTLEMLKEL